MSIGTGIAITAIAMIVMVLAVIVYLWADYTERKAHMAFIRRNTRNKKRDIARAEQEIKNTVWEACEFAVNNLKKEAKR